MARTGHGMNRIAVLSTLALMMIAGSCSASHFDELHQARGFESEEYWRGRQLEKGRGLQQHDLESNVDSDGGWDAETLYEELDDQLDLDWDDEMENVGTVSQPIVGGTNAPKNRYPYMTWLILEDNKGVKHGCGGALIHPWLVLTAAHCIDYGSSLKILHIKARIGGLTLSSTEGWEEISGQKWYWLKSYNKGGYSKDDVAIIRLRQASSKRPVKVNTDPRELPNQTPLTVMGFGMTRLSTETLPDTLQHLPVKYRPRSDCHVIRESLCAYGAPTPIKGVSGDTCFGDSGGPLVRTTAGQDVVYGIVSWGDNFGGECGGRDPKTGLPKGVYADVAAPSIAPFIERHLKNPFL